MDDLKKLSMVSVRLAEGQPLLSTREITTPETAVEVLGEYIREADREMVAVICCDTRMRPICGSICHIGTIDRAPLSPAAIMRPCILSGGTNIFVMHNHPSGSSHPSKDDIRVTERLSEACDICGLRLRDHIIVGHGRSDGFSFMEHGMIPQVLDEQMAAEQEGEYKPLSIDPEISVYEGKTSYHTSDHSERVKELTAKLEQGVEDLRVSENYKRYLDVMSRFHHYSPLNCLLIAMQCPHASYVASYTNWKRKFHRQVRKGEKSLGIFAPAPFKTKIKTDKIDPVTGNVMHDQSGATIKEEKEVTRMAYRVVPCFDVSQTDGEPMPEVVHKLDASVEGYEDMLHSLFAVSPVPIKYEDIRGNSNGYFDSIENRIAIKVGMSEAQTIKTTIHEIAHSLLHAKGAEADAHDRRTREVEAESVAYVVCQHYGINTSDYTFGYIAGWAGGKELSDFKESFGLIRSTASGLIDRIDAKLVECQELRSETKLQEQKETISMRMT